MIPFLHGVPVGPCSLLGSWTMTLASFAGKPVVRGDAIFGMCLANHFGKLESRRAGPGKRPKMLNLALRAFLRWLGAYWHQFLVEPRPRALQTVARNVGAPALSLYQLALNSSNQKASGKPSQSG